MPSSSVDRHLTPLLLLSSVRKRTLRGPAQPRQFHCPAPALCYVLEGTGSAALGGIETEIKPRRLYYIAPGITVELMERSEYLTFYMIFMTGATARRRTLLSVSTSGLSLPFSAGLIGLKDAALLQAPIEHLYETNRRRAEEPFALNVRFQAFLHNVLHHMAEAADEPPARKGINDSVSYIHRHFQSKISLDTLSGIAGFTPTSYSREFKRLMRVTPVEYLNGYRIRQAKQMLAEHKRTVKEIASASGFGNEFYFSRMFKREVGLSPSQYMNRRDLRVAVASTLRFQDILASLGTQPICATNCHKDKTMDREMHSEILAAKLKEIRKAEPDLIVCDHYHQPFLEALKKIAPTVTFSLSMDWRVNHRNLAEIVGREEEAEHNLKMVDQKVRGARQQLRELYGDESVTIMRVIHKLIRIQGMSNHPLNDLLYNELELKPGYCVPANVMNVEFSPEKYPDLHTDHIFMQEQFFSGEDEETFRRIANSPKWNAIRAVRNNRVHFTPNWVGLSWSPGGRKQIIDELLLQ